MRERLTTTTRYPARALPNANEESGERLSHQKTSNVRKRVRDATTYSRVLRSYFIKRNDNMALKQLKI